MRKSRVKVTKYKIIGNISTAKDNVVLNSFNLIINWVPDLWSLKSNIKFSIISSIFGKVLWLFSCRSCIVMMDLTYVRKSASKAEGNKELMNMYIKTAIWYDIKSSSLIMFNFLNIGLECSWKLANVIRRIALFCKIKRGWRVVE